jgi:hypothetical protein
MTYSLWRNTYAYLALLLTAWTGHHFTSSVKQRPSQLFSDSERGGRRSEGGTYKISRVLMYAYH